MAYGLTSFGRSRFSVGNPLPSVIAVALLTAALGGVLVYRADWAGISVLAGLAGYAIVSGIVVAAAGLGRGHAGFGIANQVTLLRAGLVCLASGALLAGAPSSISGWSLAALVAAALCLDAVDGLAGPASRCLLRLWRPVRSRDRCAADPGARAPGLAERPRRAVGSDDRPDALRVRAGKLGGCPPCVGRCRRAGDDRRCACSRE